MQLEELHPSDGRRPVGCVLLERPPGDQRGRIWSSRGATSTLSCFITSISRLLHVDEGWSVDQRHW